MSTPRCLRIAVEACRPCKSSILRSRPAMQPRQYATKSKGPKIDITAGFPTPEVSQLDATPEQPQPATNPEHVQESNGTSSEQNPQLASNNEKKAPPMKTPPKQPDTVAPIKTPPKRMAASAPSPPSSISPSSVAQTGQEQDALQDRPYPPNVVAAYRTPMRYPAEHRLPVGSLQLRSYSVRNLEFFADFAMRAAFYLQLPASGPVPLPKIIERWTVPRSNFVHKKSQENFERITLRRLITVMDGEKSVVETWLAFLRKWQFYGVGMKANVWEFEGLDVAAKMDRDMAEVEKELDQKLANFGFNKSVAREKSLQRLMEKQGVRHVGVPMANVRPQSTTADQRI